MGKSLTETAKAILMKEGAVPSVSSSDNNPDRDAKSSNENKASLKPKSKTSEPDPKHNEATLVADAPKKPGDGENVGAKAATKGKDTSIKSSVSAEAMKKLSEEEKTEGDVVSEEEIEISEELADFIDALIAEGLSEEEITAAIEENFEFVTEEETEGGSESGEAISEEEYQVDMQEHVDALFEGEDLSEEFKAKALTIFEAAVTEVVKREVAIIEKAIMESAEEELKSIQEEIANNVDDYLNYVVEGWVQENEVAIESGLRTEITEDFIAGLKNLFTENYIDIPEDKVSVVESLTNKIEELEGQLNEEIQNSVKLTKMLSESHKTEIFNTVTEGLVTTQVEKLKSLAESIEFTSPEEYQEKIETLKESYFPSNVKNGEKALDKAESTDGKSMIAEDDRMSRYVRTLGKQML